MSTRNLAQNNTNEKLKELTNYLLIGILTTTVSLITYLFFTATFLTSGTPKEIQLANFLSWLCSVIFAYYTSRDFVFKSKETNKMKEVIFFLTSRVITLILEIVLIEIMLYLFNSKGFTCKLASQALAIISNYVLAKLIVFK